MQDSATTNAGMRRLHFSLGDSTIGPIGLCAVIRDTDLTEDSAVAILRDALPDVIPLRLDGLDLPQVEYINIYINQSAIGAASIDCVDDADDRFETEFTDAD